MRNYSLAPDLKSTFESMTTGSGGRANARCGIGFGSTRQMYLFLLFCLSMVLLPAWPARSATSVTIEGVEFPKTMQIDDTRMSLNGVGLLRYMVFIKAYVGALYVPETVNWEDVLDPIAKRLELEYFHSIKKEDFAKATRLKIEDNVSPGEMAALKESIDRLAEMYRDVEPGDRYALTFVPGSGTQLALNGEVLGTIPGEAFSRAVFSIWLGRDPIDTDFRDLLLGAS